jgi:hypothetical protein
MLTKNYMYMYYGYIKGRIFCVIAGSGKHLRQLCFAKLKINENTD